MWKDRRRVKHGDEPGFDGNMDEGLTAGNGHIVGVLPALEEENLLLDLVQRLVAGQSLPITTFTAQVADVGDF
ncbi:MAG TPA: hypothetical protein VLY63_20205 [Anaerolineae bacterium]|nr:hypothetical protein [Anaerolineae bacterium]